MNQVTTKAKFLYEVAEIFETNDCLSIADYLKDVAGNQPETIQDSIIKSIKDTYVYLLFNSIG